MNSRGVRMVKAALGSLPKFEPQNELDQGSQKNDGNARDIFKEPMSDFTSIDGLPHQAENVLDQGSQKNGGNARNIFKDPMRDFTSIDDLSHEAEKELDLDQDSQRYYSENLFTELMDNSILGNDLSHIGHVNSLFTGYQLEIENAEFLVVEPLDDSTLGNDCSYQEEKTDPPFTRSQLEIENAEFLFVEPLNDSTLGKDFPRGENMPADSMHSVIESNYRGKIIWAPSEWPTIITNSRVNPKPYEIIIMTYKDFKDWKAYQANAFNSKCEIQKIKRAIFCKDDSNNISLYHSYNTNQACCGTVRVNHKKRTNFPIVKAAYTSRLPISVAKRKDLLNLCSKNIIPRRYQKEYSSFPSQNSVKDLIPDEDFSSEE